MIKVVGVRFRDSGKVYYFAPGEWTYRDGDAVIVETAQGLAYGNVVLGLREVTDDRVSQPLRPVLRIATEEDRQREKENRENETEAYRICQQKIAERHLDMKLIKSEYTFDKKKILFYFTAEGRVDFRELVKDLAAVFKTRIELRQVGVRDETKLLGGIGICGRALCCSTFLSDFSSVSIKMAKEQNLSLNPTKISGTCGRLMCCLKNEQETYEYLNKTLPGVGDIVKIAPEDPEGDENRVFEEEGVRIGEVHSVNVLRQTARVVIEVGDEKEMEEVPAGRLEVVMTRRKKNKERAKERERLQKEKKEQKEREKAQKGKERHTKDGEENTAEPEGPKESAEKEERSAQGGSERRRRRRRNGSRGERKESGGGEQETAQRAQEHGVEQADGNA